MTGPLRTLFVLLLLALPPWRPAMTQEAVDLTAPFTAEDLSIQDRRFLQVALAFEGTLPGPLGRCLERPTLVESMSDSFFIKRH